MKIKTAQNGVSKTSRKFSFVFLSGGMIMILGCQTSPNYQSSVNTLQHTPVIASADYQKNLQLKNQNYQNQFRTNSGIDVDGTAKTSLLQAINTHLSSPHVAVTQTRIHDAAYIKEGSIDQNSNSAYRTILEFAIKYIADSESVARNGDEWESDDEGYLEDDHDTDNEEVAYQSEDDDYQDGQANEYEGSHQSTDEQSKEYQVVDDQQLIDRIYKWYNRSPAQIDASNYYVNQNMAINKISEFDPINKKVSLVYSYDFASPTTLYSIQLPLAVDFNQSQLTLDPSALLPLVALITPEHAPLPEELDAPTVSFKLPPEIIDKVPPEILYDAFIAAVNYSLSELDSSNFTALDISKDSYAKTLEARSAVKLNLDSKQTGKLIGVMVKHLSNSLQDYVDLRPDQFTNSDAIRVALENWQKANKKFQSSDIGSLFQLIEAVAPISFNQSNYYYLDSQGKLLGTQSSVSTGGDFMGATTTILSQTSYNKRNFTTNPLHQVFEQSCGKALEQKSPASLDGNTWFKKIQDRNNKLEQAYMARYDYESNNALYGDSEDSVDDEEYRPSIRIIDYGNVNDYEENDNYEPAQAK